MSGVTYGTKRSLDGNFSVTSLPLSGLVLLKEKKGLHYTIVWFLKA